MLHHAECIDVILVMIMKCSTSIYLKTVVLGFVT